MWRGYGVTRMVYGGRIGEVEVVLGVFLATARLRAKRRVCGHLVTMECVRPACKLLCEAR
ncbi:hypothetical protein Tco_1513579, partial [Tanacetum coccineum]